MARGYRRGVAAALSTLPLAASACGAGGGSNDLGPDGVGGAFMAEGGDTDVTVGARDGGEDSGLPDGLARGAGDGGTPHGADGALSDVADGTPQEARDGETQATPDSASRDASPNETGGSDATRDTSPDVAKGGDSAAAGDAGPCGPSNPAVVPLPVIGTQTFDVTSYGAVGDGKTIDTTMLQAALDAASTAGGGTVLVPSGTFLSGPIVLGSGTRLELASDAELEMRSPASTPPTTPTASTSAPTASSSAATPSPAGTTTSRWRGRTSTSPIRRSASGTAARSAATPMMESAT
jgi:hypothetical protein